MMDKLANAASTLGLQASFGFGDRMGVATVGHIEAMRICGGEIAPVFAQQSIREMQRTGREPNDVMRDAMQWVEYLAWDQAHGADADHLKTAEDIERTASAGFTFFTLDPSGEVDQAADDYAEEIVREKFEALGDACPRVDHYLRKQSVTLPSGTELIFDQPSLMRAAVKYGRAIKKTIELSDHVRSCQEANGGDFEIELSVDETEQPTTLVEHFVIAEQCLQNNVKLISLAPRFIGGFEKGVDFIGDVSQFEQSLNDHAAIAEMLGPYKLSLHSGSDKLSIYPALARATKGRFHVKTAGTSYLEALRVAALEAPALFRRICEFARAHYETDRATYHLHATLEDVPPPQDVADDVKLQDVYLERWANVPEGKGFTSAGRQILHCTFGSVLCDGQLGNELRECIDEHPDVYMEVLAEHFSRHLRALQPGA